MYLILRGYEIRIQMQSVCQKRSVFNVVEGEAGQRATLNWQPVKTLTFITPFLEKNYS